MWCPTILHSLEESTSIVYQSEFPDDYDDDDDDDDDHDDHDHNLGIY